MTNSVRDVLDDFRGERACIEDHHGWKDGCHQCTAHAAVASYVARVAAAVLAGLQAAYSEGLADGWHPDEPVKESNGINTGVSAMRSRGTDD